MMLTPEQKKNRRRELRFNANQSAYQYWTRALVHLYEKVKCGLSREDYLKRLEEITRDISQDKRLFAHYRVRLEGVNDGLSDRLWKDVLVWTHVINGERVDAHTLASRNDVDWKAISDNGQSAYAVLVGGEYQVWNKEFLKDPVTF